jgi:hypothetical protein
LVSPQKETKDGCNNVINVFDAFGGEAGEREASRTIKKAEQLS